jgi:hypothetical protein
MIHRIKALGLALVALAALGALVASAAQAARLDVPGRENAVIRGEREGTEPHVFQIPEDNAPIKCTIANLEGTLHQAPEIKELKEGTLTATYSGCKAGVFGEPEVTVDMNGCKYTITGESNAEDPALRAWVDITGCTVGKHIEITIPSVGCTITVFEQNTLSHIVASNVANVTPKHIRVEATVSGLAWQQDGAFCPRGNGTQGTNAEFFGETTVKAYEDKGNGVQETEFGHQFTTLVEGPQVDLIAT